MKKISLLLFVLLLTAFVFGSAFAQTDDASVDSEDDWTEYFNSFDRCFDLLNEYNEDLTPYLNGTSPIDAQKWRDLRQDLRWDGAVTCGYISCLWSNQKYGRTILQNCFIPLIIS